MSLIERAADILGPLPQAHRPPAAADARADTAEPDVIERAVSSKIARPDFSDGSNSAAGADAGSKRARPVGRISRTLKIDMDKLRQQSIITPDGERTPIGESFRRIKRQVLANVTNSTAGAPTNLIMVTSSLAGEGKTFCATNLAISIAMEMDRRVLLVDADVAKPSIPRTLGFEAGKGLMDVLLDGNIDLADVICRTDIDKLTILPAGTGDLLATELLASDRMRALLEELAQRYHDRIIIFDSPPLLAASESAVLASRMGQIVMVVEAGRTTETTLKDALHRIGSCNVVGLLLNKGGVPSAGYYYGAYGAK